MAKMKVYGFKIPRKILGFKLSNGSRKDLRKVLKGLESPEARSLALSVAGAVVAILAEHAAQREGLVGRVAKKVAPSARAN